MSSMGRYQRMGRTMIKPSEHVLIAGMTGGGKSYLAQTYLAGMWPVLKLDTKGEAVHDLLNGQNPWPNVDPGALAVVLDFESLRDHDFTDRPYCIYVPDGDPEKELDEPEELDDPKHFNNVFGWFYEKFRWTEGGARLWIDELKDVVESPHRIDRNLKQCYTKGRFFDIGVWGLTQEPRHIHSLTMSQPRHVFSFDMSRMEDRKKLADNYGAPEFLEMPGGYHFWYFQQGWKH